MALNNRVPLRVTMIPQRENLTQVGPPSRRSVMAKDVLDKLMAARQKVVAI